MFSARGLNRVKRQVFPESHEELLQSQTWARSIMPSRRAFLFQPSILARSITHKPSKREAKWSEPRQIQAITALWHKKKPRRRSKRAAKSMEPRHTILTPSATLTRAILVLWTNARSSRASISQVNARCFRTLILLQTWTLEARIILDLLLKVRDIWTKMGARWHCPIT